MKTQKHCFKERRATHGKEGVGSLVMEKAEPS